MNLSTIAALLILSFPLRAAEPASGPALVFRGEKGERLRVTAAELAKRPAARTVQLLDPFYKRRKAFRAVPLKDLLTQAYGPSWMEDTLGELFFDALDGYRSHARVSKILEEGALVAFEDLDARDGGWETIPGKNVDPGPFRLVWAGSDQGPKSGYPWPWQLDNVKIGVLEDEYPNAVPRGVEPTSSVARGWVLFKRSCVSCHAVSGDGGTLGPDLNAPRGITRYQSRKFLRAFIRKPSSFRRTKMPDFDELSDRDLKDILAYFDHMTAQAATE